MPRRGQPSVRRKPTGLGLAAMTVWAVVLVFVPGNLHDEIQWWWRVWVMAPKVLLLGMLALYGWARPHPGAIAALVPVAGCLLATTFMLNAAWRYIHEDAIGPGLALLLLPVVDGALLVIALIAIEIGLVVARHRTDPLTHCTRCGYDLAGLTGGVCPECGMWVRLMGDERGSTAT